MTAPYILILYYSKSGSIAAMAQEIARGISNISALDIKIRTVANLNDSNNSAENPADLYCSIEELNNCAGLILGSPCHFGTMATPLKYFLDQTSNIWLNGGLINKPAAVFTSSSTPHAGQESTLLSMLLPLLHHGMIIMGVPYSTAAIHNTTTGGSPYGAGHLAIDPYNNQLSNEEKKICRDLGKRLAENTLKLLA